LATGPPRFSGAYGGMDFPELLHRVGAVHGLRRLRFATSHPRDMNREIIGRIANVPRLQPWMHLPVQSGSERVLSDMSREYSLDHYRGVVEAARAAIPDLALTTDIIVGFPGEAEADFDATVRLLEEIRYDALYAFKYSPRSGTAAAEREDGIPEPEKQRRLSMLLALQRTISHERNQRFVGRELETLVETLPAVRGMSASVPISLVRAEAEDGEPSRRGRSASSSPPRALSVS
jgi:tRNA-2-methylthio-N6-dimethylallyladenosine synthase